jgi:hypothetical protein
VSSGDGMDTGSILALESLSTVLLGNYWHLQRPQALDRPTMLLGDRSREHTAPMRLFLGDSAHEHTSIRPSTGRSKCIQGQAQPHVGHPSSLTAQADVVA